MRVFFLDIITDGKSCKIVHTVNIEGDKGIENKINLVLGVILNLGMVLEKIGYKLGEFNYIVGGDRKNISVKYNDKVCSIKVG